MKALKRLFWLLITGILFIPMGCVGFFVLIIYGGKKADEIFYDPIIRFLYNKIK